MILSLLAFARRLFQEPSLAPREIDLDLVFNAVTLSPAGLLVIGFFKFHPLQLHVRVELARNSHHAHAKLISCFL
jgi:hypothetical protein